MQRLLMSALVCLLLAASTHAQAPPVVDALDGVDPVVLIQQGKEVFGKGEYSVVRGRFRYLFSSSDSKAAFERDPAKYEIQFGGLCARMGRTASGNPADFLVHDGKIYIFGSDTCHKNFAAAPARYLPPPSTPISTAPTDMKAGRALFDRAVSSLGGRARLDALQSYMQTATQVQTGPMGEAQITQKLMWRSSGELRQERTVKTPDRSMTTATLLTSGGAWFISSKGQAFPMIDAARNSLQVDSQRNLIALVRAGFDSGAALAATGPATIQGLPVEQVRITNGALDVTVGIDPASGEPRTLAFVERNDDGHFGQYVVRLSDFRTVEGLRLPFKVQAQFDGEPEVYRSWTVESIKLNGLLDDSLFRVTAGGL